MKSVYKIGGMPQIICTRCCKLRASCTTCLQVKQRAAYTLRGAKCGGSVQKCVANKKCNCVETVAFVKWRRGPESNRPTRICNPVHNRFATAPYMPTKKGSGCFPDLLKDVGQSFNVWSGIRGSNSRPIPWQGIALPTELIPHLQSTQHSMPLCLRWTNCSAIFKNF